MASGRWSSTLGGVHRWWKYEQSRKCSVATGLLLGATAGLMKVENLHGEGRKKSNTSSLYGDQANWRHETDGLSVLSDRATVLPSNFEDDRAKRDDTIRSRLRGLLASKISVAYSEALPVEQRQRSNSGAKEVYFTRQAIADAFAKASPAVVNITVSIGGRMTFAQTAGSGFIIDPDGTILTNAHVVADESVGPYKGKIVVTMQDGRNFPGEIVSYDVLSDIAVIKVHSSIPLPTVEFGSSGKLRPGEWVVAVGSPLHLQNSVTVGIVSCVDRKSTEMGLRGVHADYIQTDAAINQAAKHVWCASDICCIMARRSRLLNSSHSSGKPNVLHGRAYRLNHTVDRRVMGNSGGPLLNLDGQVIGINTMKALAADGVSFAIPIDSALRITQQLKKNGRVVRPWLGMKMLGLTEDIITQLKERDSSFPDVKSGVLVPQVIPGSPAERAGVRSGDVIVEFDGRPVSTPYQIVEVLEDKVGVPFKLLLKRGKEASVTLSVITEEAIRIL